MAVQGGQTRALVPTRPLVYNRQVDRGGQTISATEFAELTGISRERLRTWERRFGFPEPRRVGRGPRRYAIDDAPRVVAVRRAAEQGVPLAHAIAQASGPAKRKAVPPAILASAISSAPRPTLLVSGPEPLRLAHAAGPPDRRPRGLAPGARLDVLPWFAGSALERTLRTLFTSDAQALECAHPAWSGTDGTERSLAYRLPPTLGWPPLVALVGTDPADRQEARRELRELRRSEARMRARGQQRDRWIGLTAMLAERFQREAGDAVLGTVTATMVRGLGAADATVAVYTAGELALEGSTRALLSPRRVTVTGYDDLATLMRSGRAGWLASATCHAFGIPAGLEGLGVPIVVVGETLGLLVLVFEARGELDDDAHRLLSIVSAGLGFLLLRERLVVAGRGEDLS
jgi:DNA-binding transcriptional MerR regulator